MFVDDADLSPIVFVPLSILFPHLGYGPAIESDGLNFGHVVVPGAASVSAYSLARYRQFRTRRGWTSAPRFVVRIRLQSHLRQHRRPLVLPRRCGLISGRRA